MKIKIATVFFLQFFVITNSYSQLNTILLPYEVIDNDVLIPISFSREDYSIYEDFMFSSDSIEINSDDFDRYIYTNELASSYFEYDPTSELVVFDYESEVVGYAKFSHIEFISNTIEGVFVACYRLVIENPPDTRILFAIKDNSPLEINNSIEIINNKKLKIGVANDSIYYYCNQVIVYSKNTAQCKLLISSYQETDENCITEVFEIQNDNKVNLLRLSEAYLVTDAFITKIDYNGRPILIVDIGVPDTDVNAKSILSWKDDKYILQ